MDRLDVLIKEYETLRSEILGAITHRTQIISLGFGAIGTFVAGTFLLGSREEVPNLIVAMFSVAIPLASLFVLYLWLTEIRRQYRAAAHLAGLETSINRMLGTETTLSWETGRIEERRKSFGYYYYLVVGMFAGIAIASPFVGLSATSRDLGTHWWAWALPASIALAATAHVWMSLASARRSMLDEIQPARVGEALD